MNDCNSKQNCAAVILAGGEGQRLRSICDSKPLLTLAGRSLIDYQINSFSGQFAQLLINSENQQLANYKGYQLPLISDGHSQRHGPLAGILACMRWLQQHHPHIEFLQLCPVDTPLQPKNLHRRLAQAMAQADIAFAQCPDETTTGVKWQPLHSLWRISLSTQLEHYLEQRQRRVMAFVKQQITVAVDFPRALDFYNINTPEDAAHMAEWLKNPANSPE